MAGTYVYLVSASYHQLDEEEGRTESISVHTTLELANEAAKGFLVDEGHMYTDTYDSDEADDEAADGDDLEMYHETDNSGCYQGACVVRADEFHEIRAEVKKMDLLGPIGALGGKDDGKKTGKGNKSTGSVAAKGKQAREIDLVSDDDEAVDQPPRKIAKMKTKKDSSSKATGKYAYSNGRFHDASLN